MNKYSTYRAPLGFRLHEQGIGRWLAQNYRQLGVTLTALACIIFSSVASATTISAQVDRQSISLSETLTLTVRVDEQATFSAPSFTDLEQHFDILKQHKSQRYQSSNGNVSSVTEWQLRLGPKREGQLIIPSFEYDGSFSDAITITVSKQAQRQTQAQQDIFLESSLDKSRAFVQEQVIFTQKLYSSVNISSFDPQALELPGARVESLAQFDYQTRINGRPYVVVEIRYAIYPQLSETLNIPSLRWSISTSGGRRNVFDPFGNNGGSIRRLDTQASTLEVLAQPAPAKPWLPASNIQLQQSWSQDPSTARQGEPITRTLTIAAQGLTAAQLPRLKSDANDSLHGSLKSYPEQAKMNDQRTAEGITGQLTLVEALIPSQAGDITLPELSIKWWNTANNSWQHSSLPAQTLSVAPAPGQAAPISTNQDKPVTPIEGIQAPVLTDSQNDPTALATTPNQDSASPGWALLYSALASLLILALGYLFWRQRQELAAIKLQLNNAASQKQAVATATKDNTLEDIEAALKEKAYAKAYSDIQRFIQQLATQGPAKHPGYKAPAQSSELQEQLDTLSAALYSSGHSPQHSSSEQGQGEGPLGNTDTIDSALIIDELKKLEAQSTEAVKSAAQSDGKLPPLYPR